jgi:YD repeat-containing protein
MTQENKLVGTSDKLTTQWAYNAADKLTSMSYPMKDLGQVDAKKGRSRPVPKFLQGDFARRCMRLRSPWRLIRLNHDDEEGDGCSLFVAF